MLNSILLYDIKFTLKSNFYRKNVIILSLCWQRCYGRHIVSRKSVNQSIILHGVISLPDATSYDNWKEHIMLWLQIFFTMEFYKRIIGK